MIRHANVVGTSEALQHDIFRSVSEKKSIKKTGEAPEFTSSGDKKKYKLKGEAQKHMQ